MHRGDRRAKARGHARTSSSSAGPAAGTTGSSVDQVILSIDLPHSELHPDAIARHRSYEDQCLDTMRVCDVLIKRLAES